MPEETRHSSQQRLLVLLDCLTERPHTIRELAAACGCAESVARRDVGWLAERRTEVRRRQEGRHHVWWWEAAEPVSTSLFPASAMWMLLATRALGAIEATGTRQLVDQLMGEVERKLGSNGRRKVHALTGGFRLSELQAESFDAIVEALCYEQRLRLIYQSPGRAARESVVEPLTLVLWGDRLYLVVIERELGESPTLRRLDRVVDAERLVGERFEYPDVERYEPAKLLGDSLGPFILGEPTTVRLRFFGEEATIHRSWAWPVPHRVVAEEPLVVELETTIDHSLLHFVLRLGEGVEVLGPATLRAEVRQRLEAALGRYEAPAS